MKQRIIELSYNNHEEMFNLPINPSEFEFSEAQNNQKITLLNIGEVNLCLLYTTPSPRDA